MRKVTSVILCVLMIASMLAFGVSAAPAGTAITDAAGFAAMAADGSYYLDADITVDTTYATTFTGIFDGNGHKVTTSVPMFAEMNGTVKNLTIEGNVEVASGYGAALAVQTTATDNQVLYENIVNNATVKATASGAGALLGYGKGNTNIKFSKCVNNAAIESTSQTGGLIAYIQGKTVEIVDCVNKGKVTANTTYGGGIIGRFGKDYATLEYTITVKNCVNEGDVSGVKDQTGGIVGYQVGDIIIENCINKGNVANTTGSAGGILGQCASDKTDSSDSSKKNTSAISMKDCYNYGNITSANRSGGMTSSFGKVATAKKYEMINCGNYGKIVMNGDPTKTTNYWAAGLAAYAYGGSTDNGIKNCYNLGDVEVSGTNVGAAGLIGYVNSKGYVVENCYNAGKITNNATAPIVTVSLYYDKSAESGTADYEKNNFALDIGDTATYLLNGEAGVDATAKGAFTKFAAADLTNGKLVAALNAGAGSTVYYQGEKGPETFGENAPVNPPVNPGTGDNFVLYAVVAVVAVIGTAFVAKRKVND